MAKLRWALLILNLFLVVGLIFLVRHRDEILRRTPAELPVHGSVADFTLTERSGKSVSLSDFAGKVWAADFIFTRCAGQCPVMNRQAAVLQNKLPGLSLVSFSVDPDNDTPAVLKEYAEQYGADPERWQFLTGDKDTLNRVAKSFHVTPLGDPMFHNVNFMLVDREGRIRGYYDSNDAEKMKALEADARKLLGS